MNDRVQITDLEGHPQRFPAMLGQLAARAGATKPFLAPRDSVPQHPLAAIVGHLQQPKTEREEAMRTLRANEFMAP